MSTVSVTNLKHASASGNNITLDSSGGIGVGGVDTTTLPAFIDHAFEVQNGGGIGIHSANAGDNRWIFFGNGTSSADVQRAGIVNQGSDQSLGLATAGTQRLRIDSSGRVTMPYQPSFLVTGTSYTQTSGGASKIIPSAESFDIGANYDLANGRFTAPVSGVYLFGFFGLSYPHAASDVCSLQYRKNGSGYGNNMQFGGNSANHQGVAGGITVNMSANDYVELFFTAAAGSGAKAYGSQWNMYGHLIG